nr:phage tail tape measure protein [Clostridium muellerianum]
MTAPLAAVGIAAVKTGMDFESQMSRVQAISGATGEEFKQLEDAALDLGAKTTFSASQVGEAQENMASAGFKVNEILAATPGVLDLAASSGESLASSSSIAASAIRGFGLDASQAGHVADVLAKSAADTNANVQTMGEAFKYVAPIARGTGLSIEEVTAAVGEMADAGIDGSTAGTTLRGAISRLANPSKEAATAMERLGFNAFDSNEKMKSLATISDELNEKMKGLTDQQRQEAIATIFGQEAMSGMLVLAQNGGTKLNALTEGLKKSDGAAKQMATTMQNNTKASIEQMMGSLETAAIKLEKTLAPTIKKVADTVGNLADKFSQLSPKTQETILKAVGLTVALGGILKISGSVIGSIGSIAGGVGKLASIIGKTKVATQGVGVATGVASKGIGALGIASKLGALALNPWVLGIGAAGVGLYALYKHTQQEAVPAVDLFANKVNTTSASVKTCHGAMTTQIETDTIKISESTKKAVGAYIKMDDNAKKALTDLYVNGTKITADTSKSLIDTYNSMGQQIKDGMDKHYQEDYSIMDDFFKKSSTLTEDEEKKALSSLQKNNEDKKKEVDNYTKKIQDILKKASNEKRALTKDEQEKINEIQEKMRTNAVKTLSSQEVESKVILERLKEYGTRITAEQASNIIQNANKQRDGAVKAANEQYDKTVKEIIKMRDESHSITKDQADKLIKEAQRQKTDSIKHAGELRDGVVNKVKSMNKDVEENVDTSSGRILTKWDKLKSWWDNWHPMKKIFEFEFNQAKGGGLDPGKIWTGTNYWKGGVAALHDRPGTQTSYELYDLPRGTRVYNHDASADLVEKTAENVATKVANSVLSSSNGGKNGINVTQNIYTPVGSPSEIARQTKNNLRELALSW